MSRFTDEDYEFVGARADAGYYETEDDWDFDDKEWDED